MRHRTTLLIAVVAALTAGILFSRTRTFKRWFPGPPKTAWVAVTRGDLSALNAFLEKDPGLLEARNRSTEKPLLFNAVRFDHPDIVKYLLAQGADVSARDGFNQTALHEAAAGGSLESAQLVFKADRSLINTSDKLGQTPLHIAMNGSLRTAPASPEQTAVAKFLIKNGADIHARDRSGETPLHYAARVGSTAAAKLLLAAGADPAVRQDGPMRQPDQPRFFSALQFAARHGHPEVVELLLDHGAPVVYTRFQKYHWAESALHDAADPWLAQHEDGNGNLLPGYTGHLETIDLLAARLADPNIRAHVGPGGNNTPIELAAANGPASVVERLLEASPTAIVTGLVDQRDMSSLLAGRAKSARSSRVESERESAAEFDRLAAVVSDRADAQLAGETPSQQIPNTRPALTDLTYVPPAEGLDFGGYITGSIADETRRPAYYLIEVDFDGDGQRETRGRYPADNWGFSYQVTLPPGQHELWLRSTEHDVSQKEPTVGEWQRIAFEVVSPPNEPPWMWTFFFRDARTEISDDQEINYITINGGFQDLTPEGSEYRVELDINGDGQPDSTLDHKAHPDKAQRDDWGIHRLFKEEIELPADRDVIRIKIIELRNGQPVAASDWIKGMDPVSQ